MSLSGFQELCDDMCERLCVKSVEKKDEKWKQYGKLFVRAYRAKKEPFHPFDGRRGRERCVRDYGEEKEGKYRSMEGRKRKEQF